MSSELPVNFLYWALAAAPAAVPIVVLPVLLVGLRWSATGAAPIVTFVAAAIQEVAERDERPALVAVGSRGLGAVGRLALGSVPTGVLRGVGGPVLVSPLPGEGRDG